MEVIQITRPQTLGNYIVSEWSSDYCRDTATLLAGNGADRVLPRFTVLGMITVGPLAAAAAVAATTNAGNGTAGAVTVLTAAREGDYTLEFVSANKFEVVNPAGAIIGTGTVGTAFNKQLNVTLTAGGTPFAAGDLFTVTVTAGTASEKYTELNWSATDGTQTPRAVLLFDATAPNGVDNPSITIAARGPVLAAIEPLIWPVGSTPTQIVNGLRLLRDRGLVHRVSG